MGVSKVVYGGSTLIDLTEDSVTPETLAEGVTAHDKSGALITGTMKSSEDLNAVLTEQEELIGELQEVLKGKAAGGSGDPSLPDGYMRCGYIQFNGEQIVDSGIVCNQNTKMKFAFVREKSTAHYMFGVASSDNTASVTAYLGGYWRFGNKAQSKSPATNEVMIYGGVMSKSEITLTSSEASISGVNEFETVGSLLIGTCRNSSGTIPSPVFVGKILYFAMWQGDTEVLHLSPVVNTDGVYRFYDEVSGSFFDSITDTPLEGGNL